MHLPRRLSQLLAAPGAPYVFALVFQLVFVGYIKDDAYIEYRYAQHLAHGQGLVFNVGDPPVEGFTSFLWTVFLALPAYLGLSLVVFAKICGVAALLCTFVFAERLVRRAAATQESVQLARWLIATNASLLVWAQSGMEPVICAAVVCCAATLSSKQRRELAAMLLFAVAATIRPECHLLFVFAAAVVIHRRRITPIAIAMLPLAIVHAHPLALFSSLIPNTALVKTGDLHWYSGTLALGELFATSLAIVPIALALAVAWRKRDDVALLVAAALVAFVAYMFRVGHDEMFLARLYLPVWPLALVLAAPTPLSRWRRHFLPLSLSGSASASPPAGCTRSITSRTRRALARRPRRGDEDACQAGRPRRLPGLGQTP